MTPKKWWTSVDSKEWVGIRRLKTVGIFVDTKERVGIIVKLRASKIKKQAFIRTKVKLFIGINVIKIG